MSGCIHAMNMSISSVEEMSSMLGGSVWNTDFRQLERGAIEVKLAALATDSIFLMNMALDRATHQVASTSADMVTFGLPAESQAPIKFGSRETGSNVLTLFDSQANLDVMSGPGFAAYTVSFRQSDVQQRMERLGFYGKAAFDNSGLEHRALPALEVYRLRKVMAAMIASASSGEDPLSVAQIQQMEAELACYVLTAFNVGQKPERLSPSNRARVVDSAIEYIHDHLQDLVTVEDLCQASACSLSTLERAFRGYFGVSPKRYLTAIRLSGVRKALLQPSNETSIGDLASVWGFWHLSKFSADYKTLYGELPSVTRMTVANRCSPKYPLPMGERLL